MDGVPPMAEPAFVHWQTDCSFPGLETHEDVCLRMFSVADRQQSEVSLDTHPSNPQELALAWMDVQREPDTLFNVHVATTTDGGTTWRVQRLADPALTFPGVTLEAFDPVVAYSPTGTLYVSYQGDNPARYGLGRLTVAKSTDHGATWTYHRVADGSGQAFWDAQNIAIAADTGTIYVQAQLAVNIGAPGVPAGGAVPTQIFLWRSHDEAVSWEGPFAVAFLGNPSAGFTGKLGVGPADVVYVHTFNPQGGMHLLRSRDGGENFDEPLGLPSSGAAPYAVPHGRPLVSADGTRVHVLYGQGKKSVVANVDAVAFVLSEMVPLGDTLDWRAHWVVGDLAADGSIGILSESFDACEGGSNWQVLATLPGGSASLQSIELARSDTAPVGCRATNEYGGLAFAADGTVWAAWSDPRESEHERIALVHLVLTP